MRADIPLPVPFLTQTAHLDPRYHEPSQNLPLPADLSRVTPCHLSLFPSLLIPSLPLLYEVPPSVVEFCHFIPPPKSSHIFPPEFKRVFQAQGREIWFFPSFTLFLIQVSVGCFDQKVRCSIASPSCGCRRNFPPADLSFPNNSLKVSTVQS